MGGSLFGFLTASLMVALLVGVIWRLRKRRGHIGPAAVGTLDEMLSKDRRNAVELIVEQRAEERRPEYPDGNLPDLELPKPPAPRHRRADS